MAGQAIRGVRRYTPRAHPVSWIMLVITTLAIVVNSIDRIILPTVLPGIISEFNLSATEGGFLVSLSFVGTTIGAIVLGNAGRQLWKGTPPSVDVGRNRGRGGGRCRWDRDFQHLKPAPGP